MTRRKVWRWFAASIVGVVLAMCAGVWFLPGAGPSASVLDVEMAPIRTTSGEIWRPAPPPEVVAQPVPDVIPEDATDDWERVHERADWIGGATVTCDLGDLAERAVTAHLDMDRGIRLDGAVDVMSRMYTPVHDGLISFAVKEPAGEARLMLGVLSPEAARERDEEDAEPRPEDFNSRPLRVRWHGAEEGTTVGCDGVWAVETGTLAVLVVDQHGDPWETEGRSDFPTLRGCGAMVPVAINPIEFEVEAGSCALQLERRAQSFPLVASRAPPVPVQVAPGELMELTLTMPAPPPMYQPPDMLELATAADMAAFFGADAAAEALEQLIERIMAGDWSEDLMEEVAKSMTGEPAPIEPMSEEDARILEGALREAGDLKTYVDDDGVTHEFIEFDDGTTVEVKRGEDGLIEHIGTSPP